ncbi:hypothetical protein CEUSTIGMA_g9756.t1 [Chlamydomonas eustigma]|uniref:Uncharacterized protein n=1 Tax=Chlamydomonas eustigma TaxID=1157962 RepID=A0A250XGX2_9CHLO|nr:hypothetical protein CEUSTIGMA_g9756.t1 [Chlamydomonas eustigma]|eukprot:GAX82327.1 hypothetical protein CEUSTIGMA_g9756.t1 [Chlamydomonas eustigma]
MDITLEPLIKECFQDIIANTVTPIQNLHQGALELLSVLAHQEVSHLLSSLRYHLEENNLNSEDCYQLLEEEEEEDAKATKVAKDELTAWKSMLMEMMSHESQLVSSQVHQYLERCSFWEHEPLPETELLKRAHKLEKLGEIADYQKYKLTPSKRGRKKNQKKKYDEWKRCQIEGADVEEEEENNEDDDLEEEDECVECDDILDDYECTE